MSADPRGSAACQSDGIYYKISGNAQDGYRVRLYEDDWNYVLEDDNGRKLYRRTSTLWGAHRVGKRMLKQERKRRRTDVEVEHRS